MGIEIKNLNPEVQKIVSESRQKYDPNGNDTIDDNEMSVLLADCKDKGINTDGLVMQSRPKEDNGLRVGMTVKEANSIGIMNLFDFADKDGNGEIDEAELRRANGPILVHNYETQTSRFYGDFHGGLLGPESMDGAFVSDTEVDFYPGLKVEEVKREGRKDFALIDIDRDGILSEKEMEDIVWIRPKIDNIKKQRQGLLNTVLWGASGSIAAGGLGSIIGMIAAEEAIGLGGLGLFAGAGIGAILVGGIAFGIYLHQKSKHDKAVEELTQQSNSHPYVKAHLQQ